MADLLQLDEAVTHGYTNKELVNLMRRMVKTYHDPDEVNRQAAEKLKITQAEAIPL